MKKRNTFSDRVIKLARSIPKGRVTTYGNLARAAGGGSMSAQSITTILSKAEDEKGIKGIPFHRIVYANGKVWLTDECRKERLALYKKEGIKIDKDGKIVNFGDVLL